MGNKKAFLFYLTLFLLIIAYSTTAANYDYDLWARLIAGMGVIDGGQVLKADFLSYTPVHTWWDHEWGSGVIFYALLKYLGPYSLVIFQGCMMFGIFFTASKIIKLRSNICPFNILYYLFALWAVTTNLNNPIRCHMFSFLLFTIFIYILELSRRGNNKVLYLIPFIIIFWNNVHGGVVSGIGLIGLYFIGELLNRKPVKKYLISGLIAFLAMFINPWGYDYIKFLLMANTMHRPDIVEWWGIFSKFHLLKQLPFKAFMFFTAAFEMLSAYKSIKLEGLKEWYNTLDKTKAIVVISTMYLAIIHVKLLPFFAITSLCYCYEDFYKLTDKISLPAWKDKVIYILLLAGSVFALSVKSFSPPLDFNAYPLREVEFIKQNNIKGKILVNFGLGSYVSYKLYPNNLIFMDGRYEEVYYDDMVPLLKKFFLVNEGWDEVLQKYPPDCMILEIEYPVYNKLRASNNWGLVYQGNMFGVFLPKNNKLRKNYVIPSNDITYYKNTLFDTDIKLRK